MMNIQEHCIKNVKIWYPTMISEFLKVINVIYLSDRQKEANISLSDRLVGKPILLAKW
jgi:hypothetical protein